MPQVVLVFVVDRATMRRDSDAPPNASSGTELSIDRSTSRRSEELSQEQTHVTAYTVQYSLCPRTDIILDLTQYVRTCGRTSICLYI